MFARANFSAYRQIGTCGDRNLNTQQTIQQLHNEWTLHEEEPSTSIEVELTTRTLMAIQGSPVVLNAFTQIAERVGLSSENHDWKELRDSAIGVLTSLLKKHEERSTQRIRSSNFRPRSIYGR